MSNPDREPLALPDPFILYHDGVYYAYGSRNEEGIPVYTSDDMLNWKYHGIAFHKDNAWSDKLFWAPEVYKVKDRFVMYVTVNWHISAAFADSPCGPFIQDKNTPIWPHERSIDNSLFIAPDGQAYVFWNRGDPNGVYVAEVESDLVTVRAGTLRLCVTPELPWETIQNTICEGPFCIEHEGKYILTYSVNDYRSQDYSIGAAEADSPLGPWKKYDQPLLRRPGRLVGTGHHSFFHDKDGKMRAVFHAHYSETEIHPRLTYITDVTFTDGKIALSPEYTALKVIR